MGDKKYVELIGGRRYVMYCACCGRNHVGQEYNPSLQGVSEYNPSLQGVSEFTLYIRVSQNKTLYYRVSQNITLHYRVCH